MELEIKTADQLVDPEMEARWAARRADRRRDLLQFVLRRFLAHEGSVPLDDVYAAFADRPRDGILRELEALDEADLLVLGDGSVDLAYPFSGRPNAFSVILADGRRRYACCAIDALGIAPMLRQPIAIRSACHHSGEPLALTVTPAGPAPDAAGIHVWVGRRCEGERRISTGL